MPSYQLKLKIGILGFFSFIVPLGSFASETAIKSDNSVPGSKEVASKGEIKDEYAGWKSFGMLDWNDYNIPVYTLKVPPETRMNIECNEKRTIKGVLYCAPSDFQIQLDVPIERDGKRILSIGFEVFTERKPRDKKKMERSGFEFERSGWIESKSLVSSKEIELDGHKTGSIDLLDKRFTEKHMRRYRRLVPFEDRFTFGHFSFIESWNDNLPENQRGIPHDQWKLNDVVDKILRSVKFLVPFDQKDR